MATKKGSNIARSLGAVALGFAFAAGLGANTNAGQESGFLKDYSQLKMEKDTLGVERRVWANRNFTRDKYQKLLLERVVFCPDPKDSDRVSMQTLNEILDYLDASLRKAIASSVPLVGGDARAGGDHGGLRGHRPQALPSPSGGNGLYGRG